MKNIDARLSRLEKNLPRQIWCKPIEYMRGDRSAADVLFEPGLTFAEFKKRRYEKLAPTADDATD